MKKNSVLLMLILAGITNTCSAQEEKFNFTWTFHFEIASYSQDCNSGFGLCFIPPKFNLRTVEAGIVLKERGIQFHIKRSSLSETLERELSGISQIPIEDGTVLPVDLVRKLGSNTEIILKSGRYPIQVSDEYLTIFCLTD